MNFLCAREIFSYMYIRENTSRQKTCVHCHLPWDVSCHLAQPLRARQLWSSAVPLCFLIITTVYGSDLCADEIEEMPSNSVWTPALSGLDKADLGMGKHTWELRNEYQDRVQPGELNNFVCCLSVFLSVCILSHVDTYSWGKLSGEDRRGHQTPGTGVEVMWAACHGCRALSSGLARAAHAHHCWAISQKRKPFFPFSDELSSVVLYWHG